jgi:hypothetical protein
MRRRLGDALYRLGEWLRYPPLVTCQVPGCGYVDGGRHDDPDDCPACQVDPSLRVEHHAFVPPPWWRRIGAAK